LPLLEAVVLVEPSRHAEHAAGASSHSQAHCCVIQRPALHVAASHAHALALALAAPLVAPVGQAVHAPQDAKVPGAQGTQCALALPCVRPRT